MFRKLKADEIQARVSQVTAKGCTLLLYKDARVDRAILDETVGPMNWQNDFKIIDGKMYGYVSIWDDEKKQWITKCDCGVESNTEAEKGEASDSFKRGSFKWGIGVELYSAPFIFIQCDTVKNGNRYELVNKYVKYQVQEIGYADNGDINKLKIADDKGSVVYELGKSKASIKRKKELPSDSDMECYNIIKDIDNIEDLKAFYNETKENVQNREAYHNLVLDRLKELKGGK